MVEYKRLQLRRDTSDNWQTENPVLMEGEIGVDLTNNNIKIGDGLKTWNELEYVSSDVDLSNYYTKDETETLVKATETTLELAIEEKVDNDTYNEKIDEIEAVLEGKANKTDIPSLDDYVTKDDYNVKMNAVDNAIATKADTETVNSRFGSVDEYLDGLRTDVDKKADASSLEDYVTKDDYDNKMNAVDNAIATKADAEETANRFNSVDGYLEDLHTEIEGKADAGSVPTKTSELTNDSGFLTEHQSLEGYATEQWVEGKGYLTEHQSLGNYYTKSETDTAIQGAKTALEGEINSKADIEDVPTYTTELTLAGRYGTTNLEVYAKEPQGIIPPNNEIWYKTTDGEYVDIINNMVFYNITNESGEQITHSVQYEDDGDLHKWIFSDDVYNVEFEWRNFELNNRITDIFIPSKVNYLFWRYQGETLKHIVFGGNTLGLNMDISSDSILELYRNERIFIDGNLYCLVKVPSEFLEEYKRYLPTTRFEAIGDIESIATTDYVETAIGVVYNFNIASGNEYELIEQARAILQGIIRGEKVIVEYRNPSNTQLVTLSYDYIVSVENNQIDLGIHNYNETNQNTWHFYGSDLYSLVMQTTFLQIPSNTEMWTFELEDGSTITKEIYLK